MREIFTRRSIRKYQNKPVDHQIIHNILKAGMNAPSAKNLRPYEFIVVQDKSMLTQLSMLKPAAYMVKDCAFAIIALAKETTIFWQQDMGACVQNMLLMAEHYDVGSCWIGVNEEQEDMIRNLLNVPKNLRVYTMISFGYKAEEKEENKFLDINRVHFDVYKNKTMQ